MSKRTYLVKCITFIAAIGASSVALAGEIVAVMAPGAAPLTKDQVSNVYIGRSKEFKPLDLPASSPLRAAFYRKATDRDLIQVRAVWARVMFTGEGQPPKEVADEAAVKKAVAADPKVIGYIDKSSVDSSVKVVLELP
jgi:hypothetical protein